MGPVMDDVLLRNQKQELRIYYKKQRKERSVQEKEQKDEAIFLRLLESEAYLKAEQVYTYVSTMEEIDTKRLIQRAWEDGKQVAVPKCSNKNGEMKFYYIRSFEDLETSFFSLSEPKTEICEEAIEDGQTICIVPAFSFDKEGYRLGYGGGYYDRFLPKSNAIKIGLCYNECVTQTLLPHGKYDKKVDLLITENAVIKV